MKQSNYLGRGLLLRSLLAGAIVGFIAGYIGEYALRRSGIPLPFEQGGVLFGVGIGLLTSYFAVLISRRKTLEFVRDLHDSMEELGELRPGLRQEPNLDHQASALVQHVDYELSELAHDRKQLESLLSETREQLDSLEISEEPFTFDSYESVIEDRIRELDRLQQEAEKLTEWFESTARPLFRGQWERFQPEGLDDFREMVEFQQDLESELEQTLQEFQEWHQVIQPWKEGSERIRTRIDEANEILVKTAELFREFPHEDLPESAEELRQETQEWDSLAHQIEQGVERLKTVSDQVEESLQTLYKRTNRSSPPETTWTTFEGGTQQFKDKVDRLKEAMDSEWLETVEHHCKNLRAQASWLVDTARERKEELKKQRKQAETINSLFTKWKQVLEPESPDNNSKQNTT